MRTMPLLSLVVALGCGRDAAPAAGADALWGLAPAGARGGIVLAPRAIAMLDHGFADVRAMLDRVPELAPLKAQLDASFEGFGGTSITLADFGFAPSKGAALFFAKDGMVAILPVVDRAKFLVRVKGTPGAQAGDPDRIDSSTCKLVRGLYACASAEPLLATLGQGSLKPSLAAVRARGDIEIVGTELPFGGEQPGTAAAVVQLARGAAVVRGTVGHLPAAARDRLAFAGTPRVDSQHTAGFGLIDLRTFIEGGPEVVLGDVTLDRVAASIAGPMAMTIPAGPMGFALELPVNDPAPWRTLIDRCPELPAAAAVGARVADGTCTISVPTYGIDLDIWLDGTTLRVGNRAKPVVGARVPMTPLGSELARGTWSFAFWGRGSMFGGVAAPTAPEDVQLPPDAIVTVRLLALVNELGLGARLDGDQLAFVGGVRTAFANPDPVVDQLLAISAAEIASGRAGAKGKPIADGAPGSPFAQDFAAGQGGLALPTAIVGFTASYVVPLFARFRRAQAEREGEGEREAEELTAPARVIDTPAP